MTQTTTRPAERAVLDRYHADLSRYQRGVRIQRAVLIVLLVWLAASLVAPVIAVTNRTQVPWILGVSPVVVLALWFLLRSRVQDALGGRHEPAFPQGPLELARSQDDAAFHPREFGTVPDGMRTYRPENW